MAELSHVELFYKVPARHGETTDVLLGVQDDCDRAEKAVEEAALSAIDLVSESLLDPGKASEGNLHAGNCLCFLLGQVVGWKVPWQVYVLKLLVFFCFVLCKFQLNEERLNKLHLKRKFLLHQECKL